MATRTRTGSKDLQALISKFKTGYTLQHTGGGHYRVVGPGGEYVEHNGKVLSLSGTAHGGRAINNMEAQLKAANVLQGTERRAPSRTLTAEERERRAIGKRAAVAERTRRVTERNSQLRERLAPLLKPLGTTEQRGFLSDLAYVGVTVAREQQKTHTHDLLASSVQRLLNGDNISDPYIEVWSGLAEKLEQTEDVQETFFALLRDARGLPQQVVPSKDRAGSLDEADWPFEMRLLELAALFADNAYQRPPDWPFIRRSAASFDERLVGAIDVAQRHRGSAFAILDGQQRFEMMKLVGKQTVWAAVYQGFDLQEEARFFLHKNKDKKAIHPYWTYRAQLTSGDQETAEITRLVESFGYRIWMTSAAHEEQNISAISALENAFRRKTPSNETTLRPLLQVLKNSTFGRASGQSTNMITGLSLFFRYYDPTEVELDHLQERISERGVPWLIGAARETGAGNSLGGALTAVLVNEYNRGIAKARKLDPKKQQPSRRGR